MSALPAPQSQVSVPFRGRRHATTRRTRQGPASQPRDAAMLNALTIVAHDLRGPLANLAVLLEVMEAATQARTFERVAPCARKAQTVLTSLNALLNGFLERVRLTGDPLAYQPRLMDLGEVVRDAVSLNRPLAESRGIALDVEGLAALSAQGDQRLLAEAVDNLVGNAVKYSKNGSRVRIVVGRDGPEAVIRVFDQGDGISQDDLQRAFNPFTRLSAEPRAGETATGLGLWIVRLIATRHGGRVDAGPNGSGGTVFTLRLPASLR